MPNSSMPRFKLDKSIAHCLTAWTFFAIVVGALAAEPTEKTTATPAPDWRALFQMHYANRVQAFREQNLQLRYVVLVGDSITEGFEVAKYFPGRRVLNRGIGADVIGNALPESDKRGVLKRLDESIFNCAATDVFLL